MEASSEASRLPVRSSTGERIRNYISEYGLIALLLVMPVVYGIQDISDDGSLARLGNNIVDGLSNGAIWALIAMGYTLVYGIIELINFAHGEVFMIGSLVTAAWFWGVIGLTEQTAILGLILGLFASLVLAMLTSGSLNVMIERVAYRPLRGAPKLAPLITAVGMSFILQNVGILWIGGSQEGVPGLVDPQNNLFTVGGVEVSQGDVLSVATTIPLVLLLTTFISQSRMGRAMR
ncbi:MAG TPA: branched-chain amino acid ABC transporter permease, partial [Thermoleophilaceae bacterium]|nr:branched-chain amino acid ABC transporter permease [Thermoleophilaceae bacterium]